MDSDSKDKVDRTERTQTLSSGCNSCSVTVRVYEAKSFQVTIRIVSQEASSLALLVIEPR
jgi:hypothetical protein